MSKQENYDTLVAAYESARNDGAAALLAVIDRVAASYPSSTLHLMALAAYEMVKMDNVIHSIGETQDRLDAGLASVSNDVRSLKR